MPIQIPNSVFRLLEHAGSEHAHGVSRLARLGAATLKLDVELAGAAGLLHDLGKLAVPATLLDANRPLNRLEWSQVAAHPVEGEMILRSVWPDAPLEVFDAVRHHHERTDGSGYPDGLRSMQPITALVAAADVYDALRTDRPYRDAVSPAAAASILSASALPAAAIRAVLASVADFEASRAMVVKSGEAASVLTPVRRG